MTEAPTVRFGRQVDRTRRLERESTTVDTVRGVLWNGDRFLLLQKAPDSKYPYKWELPGGKIDGVSYGMATLFQQHQTLRIEVPQETCIDISDIQLGMPASHSYSFDVDGVHYDRIVNTYQIRLPEREYPVKINTTRRADGELEDKHMAYRWVKKDEYDQMRRESHIAANSMLL
jgi:8-oxo-dGTP pyrophosphatase MutT (NUDIX family)